MAHGAMTVPDTARTNWPLVLLIWIAGLGAAAQYGKISVIFDRLPEIYPDAGAALGFVLSLVGAVGILLGVVAGVFVARIGYRRALLAGLIVGAAMSFVQAFWPPLPVFFATRLLEGAAHLLIVVAAPTLVLTFRLETRPAIP
jgi:DHA1 family inner membrane transport protein